MMLSYQESCKEHCASEEVLKLLIVEDHPIYLEGLSFILKSLSNEVTIDCVHSTQDARMRLSYDKSFDLILLDLALPDGGGISVLNFLMANNIFIPVVILSASEDSRDVYLTLKAGASGFISKSSGSKEILSAITGILSGNKYLPKFYNKEIVSSEIKRLPSLTPRQSEVLKLVMEGLPNKIICQRLNLTEHTVKSHIKSLFSLLDVHNRTECARVAHELRIFDY